MVILQLDLSEENFGITITFAKLKGSKSFESAFKKKYFYIRFTSEKYFQKAFHGEYISRLKTVNNLSQFRKNKLHRKH